MDRIRHRPGPRVRTRTWSFKAGDFRPGPDSLATEEPLEIRVLEGEIPVRSVVTMRTPGADFDLAVGFLYAEGVIREPDDLLAVSYCTDPAVEQRYNVVSVSVVTDAIRRSPARDTIVTSACGVCGLTSIDAVDARMIARVDAPVRVRPGLLSSLPDRLRDAQKLFERTGGLHAAGLFDLDGSLVAAREDVGRHNAMDKLVGTALRGDGLPWTGRIVLVSGRASFELVQKAALAGTAVFCAVSAPSSLAVDLADRTGVTLVGFLRGDRFNVYTHPERVVDAIG